ncbi:putative leader peptide [Crossiella sp. CA198]
MTSPGRRVVLVARRHVDYLRVSSALCRPYV